jgi:hypothetical protein
MPNLGIMSGIGLEDTACWWLAWLDSSRLLAGFSDIGALYSTNGGASWSSAGAAVDNYNTIYCCVTNGAGTAYAAAASVHCPRTKCAAPAVGQN